MACHELKLLGAWYSPFVRRVEWALKLTGVEYTYVEEDLQNKSSMLLKYNPIHKKVPVLVHGVKPIAESLVILEYIDETWKQNPILPEDPYERAMVRFWAKFVEEKLVDSLREALLSQGEKQEKAVKQAVEALEIIEKELKGKKFFIGETIGFLDIVLGCIPGWLGVVEEVASFKVFDSHKFPFFDEWMNNFQELAIIKENLPLREELIVFYHKFLQVTLASST